VAVQTHRWGMTRVFPALCAVVAGCSPAVARHTTAAARDVGATRSRVTFEHALPVLDGNHLVARVVEVTYAPGGSSAPHRHPCVVIAYVIDGALRMQAQGGPETIYTVGQAFYEAPGVIHQVSANASRDRPARFLAYFLCDHDSSRSARTSGQRR
jgi:quercetin dioxygenase-like cupin family protein